MADQPERAGPAQARLLARNRVNKTVDASLAVYAHTPPGWLLAGYLELEERTAQAVIDDGAGAAAMYAKFRYDEDYLAHRYCFPLDPINLPLRPGWTETTHSHVKLGALFDAAPDAWGRRVVQSQLDARARRGQPGLQDPRDALITDSRHESQVYKQALLRGADGIGALLVTPTAREIKGPADLDVLIAQSILERPSLSELQLAARAARALETDGQVAPGMERLLAGSWTIGGARPKAIVRDDRPGAMPGSSVIVKFSSSGETIPRNLLEAAVLDMLADVELDGQRLDVPAHTVHTVDVQGATESALVIQRFDRVWRNWPNLPPEHPFQLRMNHVPEQLLQVRPDTRLKDWQEALIGAHALRLHYVSAISIMSQQLQSKRIDTPADVRNFSWRRLLEVTAQVAEQPSAAKVQMYARLLINTALNNSDDHLKNFGFVRMEGHPQHYRVAPIFDITPQPSPSHYLHCADLGRSYTLEQAVSRAAAVGIAPAIAGRVRDALMTVVDRRADYFDARGLSSQQQEVVEGWIIRGLGRPSLLKQPLDIQEEDLPGHPSPRS